MEGLSTSKEIAEYKFIGLERQKLYLGKKKLDLEKGKWNLMDDKKREDNVSII